MRAAQLCQLGYHTKWKKWREEVCSPLQETWKRVVRVTRDVNKPPAECSRGQLFLKIWISKQGCSMWGKAWSEDREAPRKKETERGGCLHCLCLLFLLSSAHLKIVSVVFWVQFSRLVHAVLPELFVPPHAILVSGVYLNKTSTGQYSSWKESLHQSEHPSRRCCCPREQVESLL